MVVVKNYRVEIKSVFVSKNEQCFEIARNFVPFRVNNLRGTEMCVKKGEIQI